MSKQTTARKSKRERKPNVPPYTGPVGPNEGADTVEAAVEAASPPRSSSPRGAVTLQVAANQPVDFRAEYGYVGKDLKQMGLVAAAMFILLLILNFLVL